MSQCSGTSSTMIGGLSSFIGAGSLTPPFSPTDIPGLVLWLDADDPLNNSTQPANGSSLPTWVDKSGTSHNAAQLVGAWQPIFQTNEQNSMPALSFDGSIQYMQIAGLESVMTTEAFFFVVASFPNLQQTSVVMGSNPDDPSNRIDLGLPYTIDDIPRYIFDYGDLNNDGRLQTTWTQSYDTFYAFTFTSSFSDQFKQILVNNSSIASSASASQYTPAGVIIELCRFAGVPYLECKIAEILVYNLNVSTIDVSKVNNYLISKWAL